MHKKCVAELFMPKQIVMKIYLLLAFLCLSHLVNGQSTGTIAGSVSSDGKPVNGATVTLLRARDSATLKLASTQNDGRFQFEALPDGDYVVSASSVGHKKTVSTQLSITPSNRAVQSAPLDLVPISKDLAGVTVNSRRPLIEQRIDRTIVNVEAAITNVGTSALEVLEKAPGVSVDREGNISLKGKEGVLVMVDGRPTQLGGADLANLLRNMNSNQLDQIEIMTNPPARYDAAGTSGIINIKTKKTITAGMNGSVNLAYSQGKYPKMTEGFSFNYREGKVNVYTNLSHNYQKRFSNMTLDRNIFNPSTGAVEKIFQQEGRRMMSANSFNGKAGIDFFATKKTTFGAVVNFGSREQSNKNPNVTAISNAAKDLQSVTSAMVNSDGEWRSLSTNLNFRTVLDKKGREITSDLDYVRHRSENDLFMVNSYTDGSGNSIAVPDTLTGLLPQTINVYTARVDYIHPIGKSTRFEAGLKTGFVNTDNNAVYDSILQGAPVRDVYRSNHFEYRENINAAYANLSAPLSKKLTAQFGLRLENTNARGRQHSTGQSFDRQYTQLFPSVFFQYKLDDNNNLGAKIGRRVTRPSYQSLNPFIRFIDRYTYSQGNPELKPSVSNNVELSHTWKNQITTTLNYTFVDDIIQEVILQEGEDAFHMPANVSKLSQFGLAISANNPITKRWTSNINLNIYNDNYEGTVGSTAIDLEATSFVINVTQQVKINKTLTAEVNGRYRNGWLEGVLRVRPVGFVGAGLSQQILKNRGMLRLTARDIFYTQKLKGRSKYGNVDFTMGQVADTQVLTLGFTYNFSKGKKITPVKRTAGSASEEQERIGQ